jgi:hypothetical protein
MALDLPSASSSEIDFDYQLVIDFDINYGRTFDNDMSIYNIKGIAPWGMGGNINFMAGLSATFSFDQNIFDLYAILLGLNIYPFGKYLSFTFDVGLGLSSILISNHFSYITSLKINIDIPIIHYHNITIGAGIQHRNAIKIFDYLNFNSNYYGIYNSYFFEIGYRFIFKK